MHNSHDLSKSAMNQLKSWIGTNGKLRAYLTEPKELDNKIAGAREQMERKERTDAAKKLVDLHLHRTKEFTNIVSMLTDPNNEAAVEDCCRAVREIIGEVQASHWSTYVASKRTENKLVAAR